MGDSQASGDGGSPPLKRQCTELLVDLVEPPKGVTVYDWPEIDAAIQAGECIGSGGFSNVYKIHLESLGDVAAKRLLTDDLDEAELRTELNVMCAVKHRCVVSLLGYSRTEGQVVLLLPLYRRGSLDTHVANPSFTWEDRVQCLRDAAEGIHALHGNCTIHRDVKPQNVLLTEGGAGRVADFGLARPSDDTLSGDASCAFTVTVRGTSNYIAPEQYRQEISAASDVYSFGVMLWQVLTGYPTPMLPYGTDRKSIVALRFQPVDQISNPFKFPPSVFGSLVKVAARAVHLDPRRRPVVPDIIRTLQDALPSPYAARLQDCWDCSAKARDARFGCGHLLFCRACADKTYLGTETPCPVCGREVKTIHASTIDGPGTDHTPLQLQHSGKAPPSLGPLLSFGVVPVKRLNLKHNLRACTYTVRGPSDMLATFGNLGLLILGGRLSDPMPVTLPATARDTMGIPADAYSFAFVYPLDGFEGIGVAVQEVDPRDPRQALLTVGGFVYFDEDDNVVQTTALTHGTDFELQGPFPLAPAFSRKLEARGTVHPVTITHVPAATRFAWIIPGTREAGPEKVPHGGFAYLTDTDEGGCYFRVTKKGDQ